MSATAKSELDTFLDTNHITDAEFKQFIEENKRTSVGIILFKRKA